MKKFILILICFLLISGCDYFFSEPCYVDYQLTKILINKHEVTTNYINGSITKYYFLYDSGDMEVVNLKDYMLFEKGDTILIKYHKYIECK